MALGALIGWLATRARLGMQLADLQTRHIFAETLANQYKNEKDETARLLLQANEMLAQTRIDLLTTHCITLYPAWTLLDAGKRFRLILMLRHNKQTTPTGLLASSKIFTFLQKGHPYGVFKACCLKPILFSRNGFTCPGGTACW
jgi:hypothetical protein